MYYNNREIEAFLAAGPSPYRMNYPLSKASTFRIGGNAAFAVSPQTEEELASLLDYCRREKLYHAVIGNGSNVLFDDEGFDGMIILTSALNRIAAEGELLMAGCGVPLTKLAAEAEKNGLGGLEFAYGIPGTLGGAVYMNAGAYGGEMCCVIRQVGWYDPESGVQGVFENRDCAFGYRDSVFQHRDLIVLWASLSLQRRERSLIRADMNDYMSRRREKQPLEFPSAGSTFKRFPGYFTGKLIEEAGLKGFTVGGAQVSEKHAGFVINRGNATASDVKRLIEAVKDRIYRQNGIRIECEVRFIPSVGGSAESEPKASSDRAAESLQ